MINKCQYKSTKFEASAISSVRHTACFQGPQDLAGSASTPRSKYIQITVTGVAGGKWKKQDELPGEDRVQSIRRFHPGKCQE